MKINPHTLKALRKEYPNEPWTLLALLYETCEFTTPGWGDPHDIGDIYGHIQSCSYCEEKESLIVDELQTLLVCLQ